MSNDGSKQKKSIQAGFTSIDNRLMAKQDITIHQKVLLSQIVSMMNSTGRYNASNDYISAITGFNKKTIGKAFKVFNERGWLHHITIPGGGRWVYFNQEHKTNLQNYIGSVEEHKAFLKSLKKEFITNDIPQTNEVDSEPEKTVDGIDFDYSPLSATSSEEPEDIFQLSTNDNFKEVVSDNTLDTNTRTGSVSIEVASDNTLDTNSLIVVGKERELTEEELEHINKCPIQVVYEEMNNYTRTFKNILDAVTSLKVDRPNLTPLKILQAINEGVTVEPYLQFRYNEESEMSNLNKSA